MAQTSASADPSGDDPTVLSTVDDIVVTANKREQPLGSVAGSVAAIDEKRLNLIGAQDANALIGRVAGLSAETSQPGFNRYIIRGVNAGGQFGWRQGAATAIYLDETPLTTRTNFFFASPDINLFDIERIEVLRGPQGTLYGSSAIGGAIRAVPNRPDYATFAIKAESEVSQTEDAGNPNYALRGAVNLPIVKGRAALRLVGEYTSNAGFIDAILLRTQDYIAEARTAPRIRDYNDTERLTLRATLGWQPTEGLEILPSLLYQRNRAGGAGDFALNAFGNKNRATIFAFNPAFEADGRAYEFVDDELLIGSLKVSAESDALGGLSLVSATAYQDRTARSRDDSIAANGGFVSAYGLDPDYRGLDPFFAEYGTGIRQFTQEVRLVTTGSQRLQLVTGLYYSNLRQTDTLVYSFEGAPQAVFDTYGIVAPTAYDGRDRFREQEYAAFVNAEYALTPRLKVTAGARLTHYRQRLSRGAAFPAFDDPGDLATPTILTANETKVTPRAILSYAPNDGVLLYGSAAQGFRTGGGNPPENLRGSCPNRASLPAQPDQFDADSAWSYEVGAKIRALGGRLSVNAAAFRIDWSNIQTAVVFTCSDDSVVSFVDNAGNARIEGLELEASFGLTSTLTANLTAGYTRDRFTQDAPQAGKAKGDPLGYVPEWTVNIGLDYQARTPLFGGWRPYGTADYRYVGPRDDPNFGVRANPDFGADLPSQNIVDARIGLRDERFDISLFVRNLTNADVALSQFGLFATNAFQPTGFDTRTQREQVVLRPRTFGLTARVRY